MAETLPVKYVQSPFTIRELVSRSYNSKYRDRFENSVKDVKHRVRVDTIKVHKARYNEGVPTSEKVQTYRLTVYSVNSETNEVTSYPNYLLMDYLSIDAPVKIRCGSFGVYKAKSDLGHKKICADYYFHHLNLHYEIGLLFGRNTTNRQDAVKTNPGREIGMCKHLWGTLRVLLSSNFLGEGLDPDREKKFISQFK